MPHEIHSYSDFWPVYLRAHSDPRNRACHYMGALTGLAVLVAAYLQGSWALVPLAFVLGYAWSWAGHFFLEGNRPATFGYPLWSFVSEVRMVLLFVLRWLPAELEKHGIGSAA